MSYLFAILLGVVVAYGVGWDQAHVAIAEECKKLGAFFVGSEVFKCIEVKRGD